MPAPELNSDAIGFWTQTWGLISVGVGGVIAIFAQIRKAYKNEDKPSGAGQQVILEAAEIADMNVIRQAAKLLPQIVEQQGQMLKLLVAMDEERVRAKLLSDAREHDRQVARDAEIDRLLGRLNVPPEHKP